METITESLDAAKQYYGRMLSDDSFYRRFYDNFLASSPVVRLKFAKTDLAQQRKLLRHGVNLMLMLSDNNIAGQYGMDRIRQSHGHGQLNITPELYGHWRTSFFKTLKELDPEISSEVVTQWRRIVDRGIAHVKGGYQG